MMFPSLSTCVCPTSELFPHVLWSLYLLHKFSWFRTLPPPQPPVVVCVLPTSPNQTDAPPHIANLEEVFFRDYPITSGKDGRRERPLTGMVSKLLTQGSLLLHQQKEQFEVLHLKITLGCFTRAWSKKGGMKFLAENMSVSLGSGNILSSLCVCSTASFLRLKPWL